jgi:hypothetical protein
VTFAEVLGIVVAAAVTVVLRWAANRWPLPEKKNTDKEEG